jgi:hypothetical protein
MNFTSPMSSLSSPVIQAPSRFSVLRAGLVVVAFAISAMPASHGQSTWLGGGSDDNWGTSGNWSSTLNNNFNSALVFSGSTRTSNTNTLTGGTAAGITFSSGASPFTLSGSAIRLSGNIINSSTSLQTINLDLALTGASRTVTMGNGGGNVVLAGAMSGSTNLGLAGTGTLTLSGNSTSYSGTVTLSAGRSVILGSNNALGIGTLNWSQTGALDVTPGNSFTSSANLILGASGAMPFGGSGNLEFTGLTSFATTSNKTLQVDSGTLALGTVAGANTPGLFSKSGAGTLVLGGTVSTIGVLSVGAGTVFVNNAFTSLTTGTVVSSATFGGSGTVSSGTMLINGTLTPGSSGGNTGLLSLSDLTLGSTGRTLIDITGTTRGTSYDAVNVTNNLAYSGTLSFLMPTITSGTFNIFDFATTSGSFTAVSGTFGGSLFTFTGPSTGVWTANLGSGTTATFTQSTGELVIVPEPTTIALAGLGAGMAGFALWRRRRIAAIARGVA